MHYTVTFKRTQNSGVVSLYINGKFVASQTRTYSLPIIDIANISGTLKLGLSSLNNDWNFTGYMDEIRLWNKTLSAEEIQDNYNRYLNGSEIGLVAYYRFDEISGREVFDISGRNGVYNENHGVIIGGSGTEFRSLLVPGKEQLAIKGVTDENGHYLIDTIPYTGNGTMYAVTPVLGVHKFNPVNKPIYFNPQSSAYSNVDFKDVSSFSVSGRVVYEGGNYPVEACSFEVDGKPLTNSNGSLITTNSAGQFNLSIPIGVHKLRIVKNGHSFAGNGYLVDAEGHDLNYNKPLSNIVFYDQTRVKLIGRVVGGTNEQSKDLGFGESKNNIGVQTVKLKSSRPQYDYQTNNKVQLLTYPSQSSKSYKVRREAPANEITTHWEVDYRRFANNMTITSVVVDGTGLVNKDQLEIGAFSGEECRGSAIIENIPTLATPYIAFLMVYGNENDQLTFRVYDHSTEQELEVENAAISFKSNDIYGSIDSLYPINVKENLTGIGSQMFGGAIKLYPTPVRNELFIQHPWGQIDALSIIDLSGRLIFKETEYINTSVNTSALQSGMYILHITHNNQTEVFKFTKE